MELVVVKSKFQVLLVPNWRAYRITVIYVSVEMGKFLEFFGITR